MMERDFHRLAALIEGEVLSGQARLKEGSIKELKNICRSNDDLVREAYRLLRQHLERQHSEARWSAFLLVKELFARSHIFRELLVEDLNEYLVLVAEIDRLRPLPAPKATANRLKEHAVLALKMWHAKFGSSYKKLDLAFAFLRDTKKIQLSDSPTTEIPVRRPVDQTNSTTQSLINERKKNQIVEEIQECQEEVETLVTEVENLFRILVPYFGDALAQPSQVSENESDLRHHGFLSTSQRIEINVLPSSLRLKRSTENDVMIEKIEENSILLSRKFLPHVVRWLAVLSRLGTEDANLKSCIDLKQRLENALRKAAVLGIDFTKTTSRTPVNSEEEKLDEDSEDDFEEVPEKEGLELVIPPNKRAEYGLETISQNAQHIPSEDSPCCSKTLPPESVNVPVIAYGADLEDWGADKETPGPTFQNPFEALHRFWRSSEITDDFSNQEVAAASTKRMIPFAGKFEPVKWFCRAPLANGQLCSRMDREKCPFHGKVIARGPDGIPASQEDRLLEIRKKEAAQLSKIPDWQDPDLLRDIEAATGRNLKVEKRKRSKKDGNLLDVKKLKANPRARLEKIVLQKSTIQRIASEMDQRQKKNAAEKFAHNWNYSCL